MLPFMTLRSMKLRAAHQFFVLCFFALVGARAVAAPVPDNPPAPLLAQVQRLTELLRNRQAVWSPKATLWQNVKFRQGGEFVLVVFTIEGFGGGNNHAQYLAVFSPETSGQGEQRFSLIDVIRIGGTGWRSVLRLNAKTIPLKSGEILISIDAVAAVRNDPANSPGKETTIHLSLDDGRLVEHGMP